MSHTYEIEIKCLLGEKNVADAFRERIKEKFPEVKERSRHSQLNHYFEVGDTLDALEKNVLPYIKEGRKDALKRILEEGTNHSVRTRDADGTVLFIVKASIGDDTSANGVSRIEFEEEIDMTLDELDELLLDSGLTYQAKWSREREEYETGGVSITVDKNAGYGYLAEFERVIDDPSLVDQVKEEIKMLMGDLGVEELPQDRLERMFAYYNENWQDYYGTDKVFVIE